MAKRTKRTIDDQVDQRANQLLGLIAADLRDRRDQALRELLPDSDPMPWGKIAEARAYAEAAKLVESYHADIR